MNILHMKHWEKQWDWFCKSDSYFALFEILMRCSTNSKKTNKVLAYAESSAFLDIHFHSVSWWFICRRNSKINLIIFQLLKIEAIQTSLFVDVSDVLVIVFIQSVSTLKLKSISMFLHYFAISFVWVIQHLISHLLSYSNRWKWSYSEVS